MLLNKDIRKNSFTWKHRDKVLHRGSNKGIAHYDTDLQKQKTSVRLYSLNRKAVAEENIDGLKYIGYWTNKAAAQFETF